MSEKTPELRAVAVQQWFDTHKPSDFDNPAQAAVDRVAEEIRAAVRAETARCIKAMCPRCCRDEPVRFWQGAGGFWAHHDSNGVNLGSCEATRIREMLRVSR